MSIAFDSRNDFYRSPFGAVEQGDSIHFRILLPRNLKCSMARLKMKHDEDKEWTCFDMFWCGMFGANSEVWECDQVIDKVGLFWYFFELDTSFSKRYIVPADLHKKSEITINPGETSWQITSYKKGFETPDWLKGGTMYQILPDRFHASGEKKEDVPKRRQIHENWGEEPVWMPNESGEITNSDFFMGDLKGITQKLNYLKELGVNCIYLNPVFEAYSNHRYDTASYEKIDPALGTNEDFEELCKEAKKLGIHVINDGVFSHTGSDSIYFNRNNTYDCVGAYNSQESPFYSWYKFYEWPDNYHSWWGFYTLPEVNETDPNYNEYINGANGIVRGWMKKGNSGWRLDVADELPDEFLENLRKAVKEEDKDSVIIGEVWEDASIKESYGGRRKFLLGDQLDTVMNYPFRSAILDYLRGQNAQETVDKIMTVLENYPKPVIDVLMNLIGTHDTPRAITILAGEPIDGHDRSWQARTRLTRQQWKRGIMLLKMAAALQFTLPGVPCIYYGDEAGMEGYADPFNRRTFPWGREDMELLTWYKNLAWLRKKCRALKKGGFLPGNPNGRFLDYLRFDDDSILYCAFNASDEDMTVNLPKGFPEARPMIGTIKVTEDKLSVPALSSAFLLYQRDEKFE